MDEINEDNVVAVLKKRFTDDEIYTYIGSVVVSVNPYRNLPIYDEHQIARYRGERHGKILEIPRIWVVFWRRPRAVTIRRSVRVGLELLQMNNDYTYWA
jgi:hypothetical protein